MCSVLTLKSGVLAEPPLVGREREFEELQSCLDSAIGEKGNTVFVSGEAGSGKTRLIHEFLEAAKQKKEIVILSGRCLSNAAVPYLPFIEAFKTHFSRKEDKLLESDETEINAWLTGIKQAEKTGEYRNLSPQAMKDLTFAAITNALSTIAACKPMVLFMEDLHWADSASLSLLHYVARNIGSARVLVLATFRSEELTADAEGYEHPLAEELRLMRRENLVIDIKLANLNRDSLAEVARNMLGGNVDANLAAKLA